MTDIPANPVNAAGTPPVQLPKAKVLGAVGDPSKPDSTDLSTMIDDVFSQQGSEKPGTIKPQYWWPVAKPKPKAAPQPPFLNTDPWVTETGTHNGTYFQVSHPPGWQMVQLPTTVLLISPFDKNACVSLMWMSGMGTMDPPTLLNNTIQYNQLQNYQVLNSTPVQTIATPAGSYRMMDQDAEYDFKGERCQHHVTSIVNDNQDPYNVFWNGSMIWSQAPKEKWADYSQQLGQIVSSFKIVPPPAPPDPQPQYVWGPPPAPAAS